MIPTLLEMHATKGGGGRGEWFHENKSENVYHNPLELRLGVSPKKYDGFADPVPWIRFWPESAPGFIHPWSLAARQQKASAAFDQPPFSTHHPRFTTLPQSVEGWPPVHGFRRNLAPTIPEMDGERDAKRLKVTETETTKPTLFVKVNMEGFSVGRKIDLKAHDSYDSLTQAFKKMFKNFLSSNYSTNATEEDEDESSVLDYILLYEDHEGDRMLIADVPWEMFITTVKRLYIAHNPKNVKLENGNEVTENGKEEDARE